MDVIDFRRRTLARMVQFTAALDRLLKTLPPSLAKNKLQDQLGRSGSSVGANYAESGAAESAKDFIPLPSHRHDKPFAASTPSMIPRLTFVRQ